MYCYIKLVCAKR